MKIKINKLLQTLRKMAPMLMVLALVVVFIPDASADVAEDTEQVMAKTIVTLLKFLNMLLWPILLMIGDLMDPNIIIGPGMEEVLRQIWVQVRNLVNIGFAVVMIIIAFYNILGLGSEGNFALKTALPKLIIGVVIVNFTFLAGKIVLDISNIATVAVFQLPEVVDEQYGSIDFEKVKADFINDVCQKPNGEAYVGTGSTTPPLTKVFCKLDDDTYQTSLNESFTSFFEGLNANNIGVIMAVNLGALNQLNYINEGDVAEFEELIINGLFSIVMFVVFAVSYITLGVVLVFRVVVLWIAMALSPLAVLFYVVPQLKEAGSGGLDIGEKVTKHILAPIIIGVTFTIGFIMVEALQSVVGTASIGISGATSDVFGKEFLITGIANMQQLIVAITCIVIVWTGVFSATNGTFAQGIGETLKGFTENAGKTLLSGLKIAPIIPVVTGEAHPIEAPNMSLGQIASIPNKLLRGWEGKEEDELNTFLSGTPLGKSLGLNNSEYSRTAAMAANRTPQQLMESIEENTDRAKATYLDDTKRMLLSIVERNKSLSEDKREDAQKRIRGLRSENFNAEFEKLAQEKAFGDEWNPSTAGGRARVNQITSGAARTPATPAGGPARAAAPVARAWADQALGLNVPATAAHIPAGLGSTTAGYNPATEQATLEAKLGRVTQAQMDAFLAANPGPFNIRAFLDDATI